MLHTSKIAALFLAKFDVRTGYTLEWSKVIDNSQITLKGLEFKSLPSGLHETNKDVIAFVQDMDQDHLLTKLAYGVSVYRSNTSDEAIADRKDMKMYSLGVLTLSNEQDSMTTTSTSASDAVPDFTRVSLIWKPLTFTSGWDYIEDLEELLTNWLETEESKDAVEKYKVFDDFFQNNRAGSTPEEFDIEQASTSSAVIDQQPHRKITKNHHMLLALVPLLENMGPLIFKIWKLALLRKRILIHNADTIKKDCSYGYCISLLSTIPQEIMPDLIASGAKNDSSLQFYQPFYNVGVNNITYLTSLVETLDPAFIASTSDEILLYKQNIYDYSLKLASFKKDSQPEIVSSKNYSNSSAQHLLKATQRDLKRYRVLYDEFNLFADQFPDDEDLKWWLDITEPPSWKESIWKGFFWWASAGENDPACREAEADKAGLDSISTFTDQGSMYQHSIASTTALQSQQKSGSATVLSPQKAAQSAATTEIKPTANNNIMEVLRIVGYFQTMTIKIFEVLIDIITNHEADDTEPPSTSAVGTSKDQTVWIGLNDINEMGLDPYSIPDQEFVIELVRLWYGKEAKIGDYFGNLCC